jgi:membrane-associated phospholipid phosphatase
MRNPLAAQTDRVPPQRWGANLGARMRHLFVFKTLGITAFTWLFFIAYFHLLRNPAYPVALMPLTALDHLIPFQPPALVAYFSLWIYVGIAPALQWTFRELVGYGLWVVALCLTGLVLFYFWPTAVPPRAPVVTGFPGFSLLQGVDAPGNACPSMHVAVAIFSAIWLDDLLSGVRAPIALRLLNAAWFVAIAYSTMAIKQHVALDAAAGALLGLAFALPSLRWRLRSRL